jgi:hypothetical protein
MRGGRPVRGGLAALRGRGRECEVLDRMIESITGGESQALVLVGEPGVGKTALLEHALESARDLHVARTAARSRHQVPPLPTARCQARRSGSSSGSVASASARCTCRPSTDQRERRSAPQNNPRRMLAPRVRPVHLPQLYRPQTRARYLSAVLQPRPRSPRPPHPRPDTRRHRLRCPQDGNQVNNTCRHISESVHVRRRARVNSRASRRARHIGRLRAPPGRARSNTP